MACDFPLTAIRSWDVVGDNGRPKVRILGHAIADAELVGFRSEIGFKQFVLPCGRCIGCRLERSRQWAVRMMHEASLHQDNCFITLTYDNEHLPKNASLVKRDFQLFMKRLRKAYPAVRIRFFHCGEYGEQYGRPHYHAILFGFDFPDKYFLGKRNQFPVWRSASLERLWSDKRRAFNWSCGNRFCDFRECGLCRSLYLEEIARKGVWPVFCLAAE